MDKSTRILLNADELAVIQKLGGVIGINNPKKLIIFCIGFVYGNLLNKESPSYNPPNIEPSYVEKNPPVPKTINKPKIDISAGFYDA